MSQLCGCFRLAAAVGAAAAVLAVAGCGTSGTGGTSGTSGTSDPLSGMSAKQIGTKAIADLKSAPSFTVRGSGPEGGQTVSIDLGFRGGKDCEGSVSLASEGGVAITVIGGTAWVKLDARFWKAEGGSDGAEEARLFAGKYFKAPITNHDVSQLASVCDVSHLTSQMSLPTDTARGRFTMVGGQRVVTLTDKAKDSTMYVTDTATPRIVKVVSKEPGNGGQFSIAYGVPATITAPPASETVSGSQFGF